MDTDAILLHRFAAHGCPEAFRQLVERHAPLVLGVARRVTGDAALAEDVAQESFFELARRAGQVQASLPAWLHCVALHRAIDVRRKDTVHRRAECRAAAERPQSFDPTTTLEPWHALLPSLDEAMARLPEKQRLLLILHFLQGHSQQEIAATLGLDQSTVSRRLGQAIEALRAELEVNSPRRRIPLPLLFAALAPNISAAQVAPLMALAGKMALAARASAPVRPVPPHRAAVRVLGTLAAAVVLFATFVCVVSFHPFAAVPPSIGVLAAAPSRASIAARSAALNSVTDSASHAAAPTPSMMSPKAFSVSPDAAYVGPEAPGSGPSGPYHKPDPIAGIETQGSALWLP